MCNHTVYTFDSKCVDCLDSLFDTPKPICMKSSYSDGNYIYTNAYGAEISLQVINGQVCFVGIASPGMGCTMEEWLQKAGGSVIKLK